MSNLGPVFYLRFFGERVFVLNSRSAASDILEKRSSTSSARPVNMVVAADLYVTFGRTIIFVLIFDT
jgi:hypothetical protein